MSPRTIRCLRAVVLLLAAPVVGASAQQGIALPPERELTPANLDILTRVYGAMARDIERASAANERLFDAAGRVYAETIDRAADPDRLGFLRRASTHFHAPPGFRYDAACSADVLAGRAVFTAGIDAPAHAAEALRMRDPLLLARAAERIWRERSAADRQRIDALVAEYTRRGFRPCRNMRTVTGGPPHLCWQDEADDDIRIEVVPLLAHGIETVRASHTQGCPGSPTGWAVFIAANVGSGGATMRVAAETERRERDAATERLAVLRAAGLSEERFGEIEAAMASAAMDALAADDDFAVFRPESPDSAWARRVARRRLLQDTPAGQRALAAYRETYQVR